MPTINSRHEVYPESFLPAGFGGAQGHGLVRPFLYPVTGDKAGKAVMSLGTGRPNHEEILADLVNFACVALLKFLHTSSDFLPQNEPLQISW